jgi:hypothetical protein
MKRTETIFISNLNDSLDGDGDFVARAAGVGHANRDARARCNTARHSDVDLIQARVTRSFAKPQDVGTSAIWPPMDICGVMLLPSLRPVQ